MVVRIDKAIIARYLASVLESLVVGGERVVGSNLWKNSQGAVLSLPKGVVKVLLVGLSSRL